MSAAERTEGWWREPLGAHDLARFREVAARLAEARRCVNPAYGAPGYAHCAACCYGTEIAASSAEEFEEGQVFYGVESLINEIERLRAAEFSGAVVAGSEGEDAVQVGAASSPENEEGREEKESGNG